VGQIGKHLKRRDVTPDRMCATILDGASLGEQSGGANRMNSGLEPVRKFPSSFDQTSGDEPASNPQQITTKSRLLHGATVIVRLILVGVVNCFTATVSNVQCAFTFSPNPILASEPMSIEWRFSALARPILQMEDEPFRVSPLGLRRLLHKVEMVVAMGSETRAKSGKTQDRKSSTLLEGRTRTCKSPDYCVQEDTIETAR
jgi:hypothetical protein